MSESHRIRISKRPFHEVGPGCTQPYTVSDSPYLADVWQVEEDNFADGGGEVDLRLINPDPALDDHANYLIARFERDDPLLMMLLGHGGDVLDLVDCRVEVTFGEEFFDEGTWIQKVMSIRIVSES